MHISLAALVTFILGLALHALAQIDAIARAKNNPASSRLQIFQDRAVPILIRSVISTFIFILWLQGQLADTVTKMGVTMPDTVGKILDIHVGWAIAFLVGYGFDSALGYIPAFKSSIPPPIDQLTTDQVH